MSFDFEQTRIPAVVHVRPELYKDERGYLLETYDRNEFEDAGIEVEFVLDLMSVSQQRVLRGLHYQREPFTQAKLVQCLSGEVFDVAVDLRENSPTFGEYVAMRLTGDEKDALFIPAGFAHGFVALAEDTQLSYKLDERYAPEYEAGLHWNDTDIGIEWPIDEPVVSEADQALPTLAEVESRREVF